MPNESGRIRVNFIFVCRWGFNPEHTGEFTFVGDIRNKALFPLQTSKKKINMASSIQNIVDYLNDAKDQFDNAMDMLI